MYKQLMLTAKAADDMLPPRGSEASAKNSNCKGVTSTGPVSYFTALFICWFVRLNALGLTLPIFFCFSATKEEPMLQGCPTAASRVFAGAC